MKKSCSFIRYTVCLAAALCLCLLVSYAFAETGSIVLEAETGSMSGSAKARNDWVEGLTQDGDGVSLTFTVEEAGHYDIIVLSASQGGHKENNLLLDQEPVGSFASEDGDFQESGVTYVYMTEGAHELAVTKSWGWIRIDRIEIRPSSPLPDDIYDVSPVLVNPNASDNARRVMNWLCEQYGHKVITGQYCENGMSGLEIAAIWRATGGEFPALLGMDLIEYSPSRVAHGSSSKVIDHAIDYWEKAGGLITLSWHWNAPEKYITGIWYSAFYKDHTNINLARIMNGQDSEGYELLMSDLDAIAKELKILQEKDVPILWRPLHEASGGWFWWGASGPEAYIKLYQLMYDKFTNEYGLNNLIWVWNGQAADWYPGDEYVDIIGEDIYPGEHVYSSQASTFLKALQYTAQRKMIILSENGCMPDPELLFRDGILWGSFCTWEGEFILRNSTSNKMSEKYTEKSMVVKIYEDDRVIKRSDLPDWSTVPTEAERGDGK